MLKVCGLYFSINHTRTAPTLHLAYSTLFSGPLFSDQTYLVVCTLVYLINIQRVLLKFLKNSNLHGLITSCTFIKFWKFSSLHDFYISNFLKNPTCTALLNPARLLILGNFPACMFITSCTIIR